MRSMKSFPAHLIVILCIMAVLGWAQAPTPTQARTPTQAPSRQGGAGRGGPNPNLWPGSKHLLVVADVSTGITTMPLITRWL